MPRAGPVERLRARLSERSGAEAAARLPSHYQRLGRVVLVRWPEELRSEFGFLAEGLARELRAGTVARFAGPAEGEERRPNLEILFGTRTETEVREDGVRYRLDAAELLYSRGNRTERALTARRVWPGERVVDLFAGIGYFALPIARHASPAEVVAVEQNPVSYRFLVGNIGLNGLSDRVRPVLGDNRTVPLAPGGFDRVLLGYLPDATPWVPRALGLLKPSGGWIHVHLLRGSREPPGHAAERTRAAVAAAGGSVLHAHERLVKSYGPGRWHAVVDVEARPAGG